MLSTAGTKEGHRLALARQQPQADDASGWFTAALWVVSLATIMGIAPAQTHSGGWVMAFQHNNGHDPAEPRFGGFSSLADPASFPQAPGDATDPYAPFDPDSNPLTPPTSPYHGITLAPNPLGPGSLKYPNRINAIHMSLIPKGPNRGKVLVWDDFPVVFQAPPGSPFDPAHYYAYQAYSIVDPSTDPSLQHRFENFLLPVGTVTLGSDYGEDLFCSGHAWSNNGDLIVVGGTHFGGTSPSGSATWVFNPNFPGQPFLANPSPAISIPVWGFGSRGHSWSSVDTIRRRS